MPELRQIIDKAIEVEPKMTFNKHPQPRRFDEEPYVELPFNRKLPIYGGVKNTMYAVDATKGRDTNHVFGGQLWPKKKPKSKESEEQVSSVGLTNFPEFSPQN